MSIAPEKFGTGEILSTVVMAVAACQGRLEGHGLMTGRAPCPARTCPPLGHLLQIHLV